MIKRRQVLKALGGGCAVAVARSGRTHPTGIWPNRPVKLTIASPPGGPPAPTLRVLADNVSRLTGQPVVVENRPGSSAVMPAMLLQNAAPDGYTLGQGTMGVFRLPYVQRLAWDPLRDLSLIAGISGYALGTVVAADSALSDWARLVEWARAHPGALSYGSTGVLTTPHLTMEDVAIRLGLQFHHVPYKGSAEVTHAVLSGQINAAADSTGFIPYVEAGKLRLLCTWGEKRLARFPSVPTLRELGLPIVQTSPYGLIGPGKMDPALMDRIHEVFKEAMEQKNHSEALERFDQRLAYMSPDQYRLFATQAVASERSVIERLGLARVR